MLSLCCIKVGLLCGRSHNLCNHASIEKASSPGNPSALILLQCVTDDTASSQLTAHPTHCLLSSLDWVAGLHCDVAFTGTMTSCLLREL